MTVKFFSARSGGACEPFGVIRERTRSDYRLPDIGEQLARQLSWEHTTLLTEDARGESTAHIIEIGRSDAELIAAALAARYWPPDAAQLPWVSSAYPR